MTSRGPAAGEYLGAGPPWLGREGGGGNKARGFRCVVPPLPDFAHANLRLRSSGGAARRSRSALEVKCGSGCCQYSCVIHVFAYGDPRSLIFPLYI